MEESQCLEKLGEKTLHQPANARLITYCPSMDLLALGSTDHQILIYRLNGQRVYGAAQKSGALGVESLCWKPNGKFLLETYVTLTERSTGQLLAVAWADGTVRLVGAESSKTVHQFSTNDSDVLGITCMGWTTNLTTRNSSSTHSTTSGSWREFLEGDGISSKSSTILDLPRDLSLIDIETSLPKLGVLPAGGGSSSLDPLFRPFDPKDNNAVDIMVVGTKEGKIHLSIYDSFVVGSFGSPVLVQGSTSFLVRHASHKQYSTHSLLMKSSTPDETLYFVPMDLRFVSTSSNYLSLLASRSTALQNLLRYIHQVQILMATEWKSTQELPGRFLRNINETLAEKNDRDIVQALYHSVATGHTFSSVREWLVDELAERGHKRWDKAVVTGLENLRRLVHENMLPALERCSAILSRLAGIAKFLGSNENIGFSSQDISLMMDTVACLHLVSSKILIQVVDELDNFTSFSLWLRYEIDRLASETSTSPPEEVTDKEATIDHSKVLLYLQTAMTTSPLTAFFSDASPEDSKDGWTSTEQGLRIFDILSKELQNQEQNLPYRRALPRVGLLCQRLTRQANAVFSQIAEAEKRNVLFGKANKLGTAHKDALIDVKIRRIDLDSFHSFISFVPLVQIIQVKLSVKNGISAVHSIDSAAVRLGDGQVKDLKFLDDDVLLVLWECNGLTSLLSMPYKASHKNGDSAHAVRFYLNYYPHQPDAGLSSPMDLNNDEVLRQFRRYTVSKDESFIPDKMEIRARDDDGSVNGRRLILLGEDRLRYLVLNGPEPTIRTRKPGVDVSMT
ncbi:hypothetical protein B7494_g3813 [Chlorociboria aeruginascens]|nr:hypothetical protein B7494_g3813 [Chlorociboria aeruginascens]